MSDSHTIKCIEGIPFIVRREAPIPYTKLKDFPDCCGPGEGILNRLIPDTFWFLKMSAACYFHDKDFEYAEPTEEEFDNCNERFQFNMYSIINRKSKWWILKELRKRRAKTYLFAVKSKAALKKVFWVLKMRQKREGLWEGFHLPIMDSVFRGSKDE